MDQTTTERLAALRDQIQSLVSLQETSSLTAGRVHVFCYPPEDEMQIRQFARDLATSGTIGRGVTVCNLFLSLCDELAITEAIPEMEEVDGKAFLLEQLHATIHEGLLLEAMGPDAFQKGDLLLVTGIGQAHPYVRVHALLEALPYRFRSIPILVLYPGDHEGSRLRLYNRLPPQDCSRKIHIL